MDRALETDHPDLVLLDLRMPVISGAEAARRASASMPELVENGDHRCFGERLRVGPEERSAVGGVRWIRPETREVRRAGLSALEAGARADRGSRRERGENPTSALLEELPETAGASEAAGGTISGRGISLDLVEFARTGRHASRSYEWADARREGGDPTPAPTFADPKLRDPGRAASKSTPSWPSSTTCRTRVAMSDNRGRAAKRLQRQVV